MEYRDIWLSVIIPVYNGEKHLNKCFKSIQAQTFHNYEVIIIDDGSIDNTPLICKSICQKDNRFHYYRIDNSGPLHARVEGTKYVKGQFFTFCDIDDYYINKKVFYFLFNKITKNSENISLVQFGYTNKYNHLKQTVKLIKEDLYVNADEFYSQEYPKLLCSFWNESHLSPNVWNKLYSYQLLYNLPTQTERVFWGDDLILNLHLLQSIKGALFISDALYMYQASTGGTKQFSLHTMEDLDKIKKYQLKFLKKREQSNIEKMEDILFSEVAAWFLLYVRDAVDHLNEKDLESLIKRTLLLPSFIIAHDYYNEHHQNWEAAILLQESSVQEYLISAKKKTKKTLKQRIAHVLKTIYMHI